jgi:hypothetical protein
MESEVKLTLCQDFGEPNLHFKMYRSSLYSGSSSVFFDSTSLISGVSNNHHKMIEQHEYQKINES